MTQVQQPYAAPPPPPGAPGPPGTRVVRRTSGALILSRLVWIAIVVVDLFLALRFIFYAFKSHNSGFVHVVYRVAEALGSPFRDIAKPTSTSGHPLIWGDLIAIAVYTVAAVIVVLLLRTTAGRRVATSY